MIDSLHERLKLVVDLDKFIMHIKDISNLTIYVLNQILTIVNIFFISFKIEII